MCKKRKSSKTVAAINTFGGGGGGKLTFLEELGSRWGLHMQPAGTIDGSPLLTDKPARRGGFWWLRGALLLLAAALVLAAAATMLLKRSGRAAGGAGPEQPSGVWYFGIGSNLNAQHLRDRKGVQVLEAYPARLSGWVMRFSVPGNKLVEPGMGNVHRTGKEQDEVHGLAFRLNEGDAVKLDRSEGVSMDDRGYKKTIVEVSTYPPDARQLTAFVYQSKQNYTEDFPPSTRYLNILLRGAKQANLSAQASCVLCLALSTACVLFVGYIQKLQATKTYQPSPETLRERAKQTARRGTLPVYTVQQLAQQCANRTGPGANLTQVGGTARVAILGYVLDAPSNYTRFVKDCQDLTAWALCFYLGLSTEEPACREERMGQPPFPVMEKQLRQDERAYIYTWLDLFLREGQLIGSVWEFWQTQAAGRSDWTHPLPLAAAKS
eukprot:g6128.t1